MTHDEAFIRSILETPEDDGVRLIYADWLEEHDNPRGEFIRTQVELSRLSAGDPRFSALQERKSELLAAHWDEWLAPLRRLLPPGEDYYWFHRPFYPEGVL